MSGARKQKQKKHNLFRHIYSVRRRNHTPISFFLSLSPPLPPRYSSWPEKNKKNTQNKFRKTGWKFYDRVRSFCYVFFSPIVCIHPFFVLGYHLINKMAKKRCLDDDDDGSFFLFGFILFFFAGKYKQVFFLCWSCAARFLWKKKMGGFIACLIAIESSSVSGGSYPIRLFSYFSSNSGEDLDGRGGVFGSGHLGRTYGTDNTPPTVGFLFLFSSGWNMEKKRSPKIFIVVFSLMLYLLNGPMA